MRLKLKKHRDGRLSYGVPLFYRFILTGTGLILLFALIFTSRVMGTIFTHQNTVPLFFIVLSLLAALYHEQWTLDKKKKRISFKTGVLFLYKTKNFDLDDVKAIEFIHYRKGGNTESFFNKLPGQRVWILLLQFHDGKKINMETGGSSARKTLYKNGKIIAEYCEVPFYPE